MKNLAISNVLMLPLRKEFWKCRWTAFQKNKFISLKESLMYISAWIPIHMQLPSLSWQRWSSCIKHCSLRRRLWSRSWRIVRNPLSRCAHCCVVIPFSVHECWLLEWVAHRYMCLVCVFYIAWIKVPATSCDATIEADYLPGAEGVFVVGQWSCWLDSL